VTDHSHQTSVLTQSHAENFPVAGWFLAGRHRAAVQAYYAFARLADDIADSTQLTVIQKLAALDDVEKALIHGAGSYNAPTAAARHLGALLRERDISLDVASDLLVAFRADARNPPIRAYAELTAYCAKSANPVGRFLLALHGETAANDPSDNLCAALQILNHIQDVRVDAEALKRCYIPLAWLNAQGIDLIDLLDPDGLTTTAPDFTPIRDDGMHGDGDEDVALETSARAKPIDDVKLQACLNKLLDEVDGLLVGAQSLPQCIQDRGLRAQSTAILVLAKSLATRLRNGNPWRYRISLTAFDWLRAALVGLRVRVLGS
jgi:hydroxysqualene synthase